MTEKLKNIFDKKHVPAFAKVVILVAAIGALLFTRTSQPVDLFTTTATFTTVVADPNSTPSSDQGTDKYGIHVELSSGESQAESVEPFPFLTGEPLSSEQIQLILARLPALTPAADEGSDFNLPQESLPPPRPGNRIEETFPPLETEPTPDAVDAGPLQVLRFAPQGEIPIAPFISITFNQAMVPLGTLGDLAANDVPVQIEPALAGTWRWLGTKTLTFEYDSKLIDRLPKATEYHVTVPAGVKSASGETLTEPVRWTFKTPPPRIATSYPDNNSPQPLDPIFFIMFDQRIDPKAVLQNILVTAGARTVQVAPASRTDIDKNEHISQLIKDASEGRWLAFRATQPLPAETSITVNIQPGTPSAEGPLLTVNAQSYVFSTYSPLRVEEHGCSFYNDQCPPLTPLFIRFNNPLDMDLDYGNMLKIEPQIPGVSVNVYGNVIEISGQTSGQTSYTVTVPERLQDAFGQQLGKDTRLTFKVGRAESVLIDSNESFLTLDPTVSDPVFSVYAINYKKINLKIYAVQPEDWPSYKNYLLAWQRSDTPTGMPGQLVEDRSISLNIPDDTLSQVDIDLQPYMHGNFGHFVVIVEPPAGMFENDDEKYKRYSQTLIRWLQITQIGLDAFHDQSEMVAWATDLADGSPLSGVSIRSNNGGPARLTDSDGVAHFDIPAGATYLTASKGEDQALLPRSVYAWYDEPWRPTPVTDSLRWHVFDDRQMYRPGEDVHIKGWLRRIGGTQDGDVGLPGNALKTVLYTINDSQGNSLGNGSVDVNNLGGFDFVFGIPKGTNLGTAEIYFTAQGNTEGVDGLQNYHPFQIQEFGRPEFEVNTRNETTGPYFAGDQAALAVEAKYYAGGGLPNADVSWQVSTSAGNYSPPNRPEFTFGNWQPWWFYDFFYYPWNETEVETFNGQTDASGTHFLNLNFVPQGDPAKDPQPQTVIAQSTVMDVNRQAWSSETTLLVHPADVYVGLRSDTYFVERGTPLKVDYIVTDLDGNAIEKRPLEITAGRLEWKFKKGDWVEEVVDVQTCSLLSTLEPGTCSFETTIGGSYQITAIVTDESGRKNQSRMTRWVSGGQIPPSRNVAQEEVRLIPDKEIYQPGETAKILVQSPFSPAEGMLTVSRSGILYTTRFHVEDGTATLSIPIEEGHIPNLNIQVDLAGVAPRTSDQGEVLINVPARPAYGTGKLNLKIPPQQRTLTLQVTPGQNKLEPGGETTLTVLVKDANGLPVSNAELTVVAVDEAILALTGYQLPDPLEIFYADRPSYLFNTYGRASIILADPQSLLDETRQALDLAAFGRGGGDEAAAMATEAPAMAEPQSALELDDGANEQASIDIRSDFNPLATFAPTVRTSSNGEANVFIKLPDNLTRYRIMVVAVDDHGNQFGTGESNLTARLPLMVRPSAPRFLNFGDKFELPVVLQNQTDLPMTVNVAIQASNLELEISGVRVTVPANDRVEVRFPATTVKAGTVHVQIAATSGTYADAASLELPVYTPATTEAFATYGVIDEGALAQPVLHPSDVFPQFGGLEITTSSTALQALTDAVLYLTSCPYEGSEQLASRILAIGALRDVLASFKAEGLASPAEMESSVNRDIARLQGLQNSDGGFPYWRHGFDSIPFNTIHTTHALFVARQKGFDVPTDMEQSALIYLRDMETHYPSWYNQETRWTLSAYALHVRDLLGEQDVAKAEALIREAGLEKLPMEAIGWLWPVINDTDQLNAIRLFVNNYVVETAGAANFTTTYHDQTYLLLSSDRRTDAILLEALIKDDPQHDLIPKLVNGLLAHRTKGRWENTQENVFALLALDRYFHTYENQTPDFVASVWLGDTYVGSNQFIGRATDLYETRIPMNYVLSEIPVDGETQDLILSKHGPGRLYYRLSLQYAPTNLDLDPLDMGFVIERRYVGLDNPEDVYQDSEGVWHIKAGTRVEVRIKMMADNRRYHVALVDPLPAGLEIVNPSLAVSENIPPQDPASTEYRYGWGWWGPWYEHQNMRDDHAEAFTSLLWDGVYEYIYITRATTPGTFIVPPARAEEMYSPEVFGRSGSDLVIVK